MSRHARRVQGVSPLGVSASLRDFASLRETCSRILFRAKTQSPAKTQSQITPGPASIDSVEVTAHSLFQLP